MSASSSEFQAQFSRLFKLSAAMAAVISLLYFWRVDFLHVGKAVFFFIFHGSAAMLGSILALGIGWRHYAFWSRAKWNGEDFSVEAPRHTQLLRAFDWLTAGGVVLLLTSLVSQLHQGHRGLLDHVLGILAVLVIGIIVSHKARMLNAYFRMKREEECAETCSQAVFAAALAVLAGQAVYYGPGCHVIEALVWGVVIGVGCFILMCKLRLPEVGDCPAAPPADAEATGTSCGLVGV